MTSIRFLVVLVLAGAVAACGETTTGTGGTGGGDGGGGTGGTAGDGGGSADACTNVDDMTALDEFMYPEDLTGGEAVTAAAGDCVTASCLTEVLAAIAPDAPQEAIDALGVCVADCLGEQVDFSDECLVCYGGITACGSANCSTQCTCLLAGCTPEEQIVCNMCINDNCAEDFNDCSGLDGTLPES